MRGDHLIGENRIRRTNRKMRQHFLLRFRNSRLRVLGALLLGLAATLLAFMSFLGSAPASADIPVVNLRSELWSSSYNKPQYGGFNVTAPLAVAVSPTTGRVFETAVVAANPSNQYATIAYNEATGSVVWTAFFSSPVAGDAEPFAIAVSPDGSKVFVTGHDNYTGTGSDIGTVAYDAASGQQLWSDTLHFDAGVSAAGLAIGVSGDGSRVYVGGASFTSFQPTGNYGFVTLGYDARSGQRLWQERYIGPGQGSDGIRLNCLVVDPKSDRVFVTGHSLNNNSHDDFAVVAYTGATGQNLWSARWSGGNSAESLPNAIAISPDGTLVFVTGYSNEGSDSSSDFVTVAFQAVTGSKEWEAHYTGSTSGYAQATAIAVSPDGKKVFVVGQIPGPLSAAGCVNQCDDQYGIVGYDTRTGSQIWTASYGVDYAYTTGSVSQGATGVTASPDSATVYVTGVAYNGGGTFVAGTLGLDATSGVQKWVARYIPVVTGVDTAVPTQLAVDSVTGKVLVAALFEHEDAQSLGPYLDYGVIAYAGDGLVSARSTKIHGSAGPFDIRMPLAGSPGVECRSGVDGGNHMIIFSFADALTSVGGASLTKGTGSVASNNIDPNDAHNYIVNLTGVTNAQLIKVQLTNVVESSGQTSAAVSAQMGVLLGDVNASNRVDAADVSLVRQQTLQPVTSSNFRADVNTTGRIDAADVSIARLHCTSTDTNVITLS
jgi:DNA-binding beta-propeller fold protein YncE